MNKISQHNITLYNTIQNIKLNNDVTLAIAISISKDEINSNINNQLKQKVDEAIQSIIETATKISLFAGMIDNQVHNFHSIK